MESIICSCLCALFILVLKIILKIDFKKAKQLEENPELQEITNKFPDNMQITKELLEMLNNNNVRIEQNKNTKTNLYIGITNKIIISDLKDNYGRIGTIAHECMHSVQDRMLILFNFVFSNFAILYWICVLLLIPFKRSENIMTYVLILSIILFIQTIIRLYLETDAMLKATELSDDYIKSKKICTDMERNLLIKQYKIINDIGIKFYIFSLTSKSLVKIFLVLLLNVLIN